MDTKYLFLVIIIAVLLSEKQRHRKNRPVTNPQKPPSCESGFYIH